MLNQKSHYLHVGNFQHVLTCLKVFLRADVFKSHLLSFKRISPIWQLPANRRRDLLSESANHGTWPFFATPSIELKERIGARKKKQKKKKDTFQKPLESLSGNFPFAYFIYSFDLIHLTRNCMQYKITNAICWHAMKLFAQKWKLRAARGCQSPDRDSGNPK